MALREWAQKTFARGEGDEAAKLAVIRLSSEGTVWETWQEPFPDVEAFLLEAEAVKQQVAEECPVRRVPLLFTADSGTGATISQFPTSVKGKNKEADALAGSGNNAAKAFAEAMEGISRVVVAVLRSAELQVTTVTKTCESQATQIHDLIEYHRVRQELDLTEQKANHSTQDVVMAQVKEVLPLLPEALSLWLADQKKSSAAPAVVAAVKAVTSTLSNGAT